MRQSNSDAELDAMIYKLGSFGKIMNAAKREWFDMLNTRPVVLIENVCHEGAKRIGLLFSQADLDFVLDPRFISDIDDITSGEEVLSDGCGLMSIGFAKQISKAKKIIFRGSRYTPAIFQIRCAFFDSALHVGL